MQPTVVNVIVKSKSARMFNLNENELFPYGIIAPLEYFISTFFQELPGQFSPFM
jgi:hypothetical protein